jgi:hypothetical protein
MDAVFLAWNYIGNRDAKRMVFHYLTTTAWAAVAKADVVLCNTFEELEPDIFGPYSPASILPIGPLRTWQRLRACTTYRWGFVSYNGFLDPVPCFFRKTPIEAWRRTQPSSSREATDPSRAPMRRRRSEQRCTGRLPVSTMHRSRALARAGGSTRAKFVSIHPGEVACLTLSSILLPRRHPTFGGRDVERLG